MALEQEIATFQENLEEWSEWAGQYVLIKDKEVCGFFSSYDDAVRRGYEKFGLEAFLVKQVNMLEQIHFISRVVDPCLILPSRLRRCR